MPIDEVPDGQVPRDDAFWRTYRAVRAEEEARFRRADCLSARRHRQVRLDRPVHCEHCGATWGRLLADWSSWRAETRTSGGMPRPGDVMVEAGEVVWIEDGPRVVKDRAVVGDDGRYTIAFHPADWPLPESFTFPGVDVAR